MSVPNTNTFTFQDVTQELYGDTASGRNLLTSFTDAVSDYFDPTYGDKDTLPNSLLEFRNYTVVSSPTNIPYYGGTSSLTEIINPSSLNINYPAIVNANDILFIQIDAYGLISFTDPIGWTSIFQNVTANTSNVIMWKRATGTESGTVTVNFSGTSAVASGVMHRFIDAKTSGSPIQSYSNSGVNYVTSLSTSITTQINNSLAINFFSQYTNTSVSTTQNGYTEWYTSSGAFVRKVDTKDMATAGSASGVVFSTLPTSTYKTVSAIELIGS